jgi:hypothetical protein
MTHAVYLTGRNILKLDTQRWHHVVGIGEYGEAVANQQMHRTSFKAFAVPIQERTSRRSRIICHRITTYERLR